MLEQPSLIASSSYLDSPVLGVLGEVQGGQEVSIINAAITEAHIGDGIWGEGRSLVAVTTL